MPSNELLLTLFCAFSLVLLLLAGTAVWLWNRQNQRQTEQTTELMRLLASKTAQEYEYLLKANEPPAPGYDADATVYYTGDDVELDDLRRKGGLNDDDIAALVEDNGFGV